MQSSANASKWVFWAQESGHLFLLQKVSCEVSCLTPLYILQVPLAGPHTTSEAQAFFHMYHSYADIPNPWDRLRWCRYSLGLLQKDVAAMVGMEEWLYQDLESGNFRRSFSPEIADKLAAFYSIPVKDLLDDYALFFHRGGGDFLRRYREAKGWNRQQLADHAKVSRTSIRWGKWTKDHQSEVLLPSGGKPWFRFSIYASHVRYGNFSPVKRKSSSASHDMWQRRRAFVMESFCFNYSDICSDLHGVP